VLDTACGRRVELMDAFRLDKTAADLPLAAMRRKIMDRLVHKSTTQRRQVSVSDDGVVTVDGQIVLSLDNGFVRHNG